MSSTNPCLPAARCKFSGEENIPDASNLSPTTTRILVADDFEPYRSFVTSLLGERPHTHVICEVSDGLDAVAKTAQLTPDLIVMDIGLPKLDGFEAARQILKLVPAVKIIFLTQENSAEVVDETLRLGASAYVLKSKAGNDLLEAVEVALRGEQYVGRGLERP